MGFDWDTLPTIAAALIFWALGLYVLTRGYRSPVSALAVLAQLTLSIFLVGQALGVNAPSRAEWELWTRGSWWAAAPAPALWYGVTVAIAGSERRWARGARVAAWAMGAFLGLAAVLFAILASATDLLLDWSHAYPLPTPPPAFRTDPTPLSGLFPLYIIVSALAALAVLVRLAAPVPKGRRAARPFLGLIASGVLFLFGGAYASLNGWLRFGGAFPVEDVLLMAGTLVMGYNVAAYSALLAAQVIRRDVIYYMATAAAVLLLYSAIFLVAGGAYSFPWLTLYLFVLLLSLAAAALIDPGRALLDRLFYRGEVGQLRAGLRELADQAGRAPDPGGAFERAQVRLEEMGERRARELVEDALRKLNNLPALAGHQLARAFPSVIERGLAAEGRDGASGSVGPLDRARALRGELIRSIEKLRPPGSPPAALSGGWLQYTILHGAYVEGKLNKQIMARHEISEGTFNRSRRQAIAGVAADLRESEAKLR
jgi:hypothetical protein